jgi:hypothetical protein
MKVNISKCGTIRFKSYPKTNLYPPLKIQYNGQIIENVQTYTYLGIVFDDLIETDKMINDRIKKGIIQYKKYENFLRSNKISLIAKSWCLKLIILPSLTYGSEIWGMNQLKCLKAERTYNAFIRSCFRLPKNTNKRIISNDLDLNTVYLRSCKMRMRIYFKAPTLNSFISDILEAKIKKINILLDWKTVTKKWISKIKFEDKFNEIIDTPMVSMTTQQNQIKKVINIIFNEILQKPNFTTNREIEEPN